MKRKKQLVLEVIEKNLSEEFVLDYWRTIINSALPKALNFNARELSNFFNLVIKKHLDDIYGVRDYHNGYSYYWFVKFG